MRAISIPCLIAAAVAAPALQAGSLDSYVEPAMVMNLRFGGSERSAFTMGLRLNYATSVRQYLGALSANPDTALEAIEVRNGSHLFAGPALTQFDFGRSGFQKISLMGRTLVTRRMLLKQNEEAVEEGADEEAAPAEDAGGEASAEDDQWGWLGWGLATAGAAGVYLLVEDDDEGPTAQNEGGTGAGDQPVLGCDPTGVVGECI